MNAFLLIAFKLGCTLCNVKYKIFSPAIACNYAYETTYIYVCVCICADNREQ